MRVLAVSDIPSDRFYKFYQPGRLDEFDLILSCGDLSPEYIEFLVTLAHCPLVYVHGKFYDIDENGQVDNMDYPAIFKALKEGGYKGYIASEFEGNRRMNMVGWCDEIEYVRKHQKLMRSLLDAE